MSLFLTISVSNSLSLLLQENNGCRKSSFKVGTDEKLPLQEDVEPANVTVCLRPSVHLHLSPKGRDGHRMDFPLIISLRLPADIP